MDTTDHATDAQPTPEFTPPRGVVKINCLSVPPQAGPELEKRFAANAQRMTGVQGFRGFKVLRPVAGESRYFIFTEWEDEASYAAWRDGDAHASHAGEKRKPVATGAELIEFEVALDVAGPAAGTSADGS